MPLPATGIAKTPAEVVMVSVALSADLPALLVLTVGLKMTIHWPVAPLAIELGLPVAKEKSFALAPLKLAALTVSAAPLGLVKLAVLAALGVDEDATFNTVSGSCKLLWPSARPVPLSGTVCVPPLLVNTSDALSARAGEARGVNDSATLAVPAAAIPGSGVATDGIVEVILKSAASAPEMASPVTLSVNVPCPLLVITAEEVLLLLSAAVANAAGVESEATG
jgi:hypothetical protein